MTFDFPLSRQSDTLRVRGQQAEKKSQGTKAAESLYRANT